MHLVKFDLQVNMLGKEGDPKIFVDLEKEDKDLTVFTIKNLLLSKRGRLVEMKIVLKEC